jgi:CRP/FNR family cyclic AMP-dependent transcriptional regulator
MPHISKLQDCSLFNGLTADEIEKFRSAATLVKHPTGSSIMTEGELGDTLLILITGAVTISKKLTLLRDEESNTRDKTFINLDAEERPFFGEMAMFLDDSRRTATVTASTACEVVVFEKEGFIKSCKDHPTIGYQVMQNISKRLATNLDRESKNVLKLTTAFSLVLEE